MGTHIFHKNTTMFTSSDYRNSLKYPSSRQLNGMFGCGVTGFSPSVQNYEPLSPRTVLDSDASRGQKRQEVERTKTKAAIDVFYVRNITKRNVPLKFLNYYITV